MAKKPIIKDMPAWLADLVNDVDLIPSTVEFEIARVNTNPAEEVFHNENVPGNFRKIKITVTGSVIYTGEAEGRYNERRND